MSVYERIQDGFDFDTKFQTFILAFCPDTDSWFVTNERFFYYEYPMWFPDEDSGIAYFKQHPDVFLKLETDMGINRPSFNSGGVWLENTREFVKTNNKKG